MPALCLVPVHDKLVLRQGYAFRVLHRTDLHLVRLVVPEELFRMYPLDPGYDRIAAAVRLPVNLGYGDPFPYRVHDVEHHLPQAGDLPDGVLHKARDLPVGVRDPRGLYLPVKSRHCKLARLQL